jgi:hypothetical protein
MRTLKTIAVSGGLLVALWAPAAGAQDVKPDQQEVQADRQARQ